MHSGVKLGLQWVTQRMIIGGTILAFMSVLGVIFASGERVEAAIAAVLGFVVSVVGLAIQKAAGIDDTKIK